MPHLTLTLVIVISHALTGTASVATRYLVEYLQPVEVAFLRYLIGGVFTASICLIIRNTQATQRPFIIKSLLLGVLFFALFPFLFSLAFKYTTAARGALVLATMPMWAMLIGHVTKHEPMTPRLTAGVIVTLAGLAFALMDKLVQPAAGPLTFMGEIIMLLTALTGAVYSVLAKSTLADVSAFRYTPVMMIAGCAALAPWAADVSLIQALSGFSVARLAIILYLGCIAGGLAFLMMNWVLGHASATFTTLFVPLNPLTAMFLAWPLLNEPLTLNFIIGALVVFTGLYIGQSTLKRAVIN